MSNIKKSDKIISFTNVKRPRKTKDYKLVMEALINVDLRDTKKDSHFNILSLTENISQAKMLEILEKMLNKLSMKLNEPPYIRHKTISNSFTLYYYENPKNIIDFQYIISPPQNESEIFECLYAIMIILEYKRGFRL